MKVGLFRVEITLLERFAVAAPESTQVSAAVDRPIASNHLGEPWIPPTSVAGSLRDHLDRKEGIDAVTLMGGENPEDADKLDASRLWILGTSLAEPQRVLVERTSVDSERGAARSTSLRSEFVLEPGAKLTIYLRMDNPEDGIPSTEDLASTLSDWCPFIGGGRSRGRGRGAVDQVAFGELDLGESKDLIRWLSLDGPELVDEVAATKFTIGQEAGEKRDPDPWIWEFEVVDALQLVSDTGAGGNASTLERSRHGRDSDDNQLVIRGTALAGVFRHRAGFILRTLGIDACSNATGCGNCPLCDVFGHSGARSRLRFIDALVAAPLTADRTHVAIDRVSRGATDKHLFITEVILKGSFRVEIQLTGPVDPWVTDLLQLIVTDIHDGYVGLGAGTARGQGSVALSDPEGCVRVVGPELTKLVSTGTREPAISEAGSSTSESAA